MNANAASGLADAGADFEQLGTQSFDLGRAPRLRQLVTKEVDEVASGCVQQQAKSVGEESMAAQTIGAEAVLELLDAVLVLNSAGVLAAFGGWMRGATVLLVAGISLHLVPRPRGLRSALSADLCLVGRAE